MLLHFTSLVHEYGSIWIFDTARWETFHQYTKGIYRRTSGGDMHCRVIYLPPIFAAHLGVCACTGKKKTTEAEMGAHTRAARLNIGYTDAWHELLKRLAEAPFAERLPQLKRGHPRVFRDETPQAGISHRIPQVAHVDVCLATVPYTHLTLPTMLLFYILAVPPFFTKTWPTYPSRLLLSLLLLFRCRRLDSFCAVL